jgi:hypothetical protein
VRVHHTVVQGVAQAGDFDVDRGAEKVEVDCEQGSPLPDRRGGGACTFSSGQAYTLGGCYWTDGAAAQALYKVYLPVVVCSR